MKKYKNFEEFKQAYEFELKNPPPPVQNSCYKDLLFALGLLAVCMSLIALGSWIAYEFSIRIDYFVELIKGVLN